jgi:hypothetical protein
MAMTPLVFAFMISLAGADDRVADVKKEDPPQRMITGDRPAFAVLPRTEGDITVNLDTGQVKGAGRTGSCHFGPDIFGDVQITYHDMANHISGFSDVSIPQEFFNMIKDNDSCPSTFEIHHHVVTCKKHDRRFEIHVEYDIHVLKYQTKWSLEMFKGKIQNLQTEDQTFDSKGKVISIKHATCGEALTS